MALKKITPFLWFDQQAEEAANFYTSIFPNSHIVKAVRCGPGGPGPAGSVLTIEFVLDGQTFTGLNGGPHFKFTEAVSFVVHCETQEDVDNYWDKLLAGGGKPSQCGWLKDRFGLSWQVIPTALPKLLGDPDAQKSGRAMGAMMQMTKLDLSTLQKAFDGV